MTDRPLPAHSLAEIYFYLMVTPCPNCTRGPLRGSDARAVGDSETGVCVDTRCKSCKHEYCLTFALPPGQLSAARSTSSDVPVRVNSSDDPSKIIDVAGWITLFRIITEAAAITKDKAESRLLGHEAAQCLEEALKFYDEDNDLPPDSAFFNDTSLARRTESPDLFARSRLVNLRAKLPTLDAMERKMTAGAKARKPWWKRWI